MRVFEQKERCSGCTACQHVCPVGAISMIPDEEGFLYPEIDEEKCIECDRCREVCPFHEGYNRDDCFETPEVYAAKHVDSRVREASTSGGLFTALSDYVLQRNGVVYGAVFGAGLKVQHAGAEKPEDRDAMRGSKYVQSELADLFPKIKEQLAKGREVIFTGTPCQVAGLKAFLNNKTYANLLLCDLVCKGTPSPLFWKDYVALLEKKHNKRLSNFFFRDKSRGWHNPRTLAIYEDGDVESDTELLKSFNRVFYQHIALRPSCHKCPFTNTYRTSDITIADFWGIENYKPAFDDNRGTSLVMINTPKGKAVFEEVKHSLVFERSSLEECTGAQKHLKQPAKPSSKRSAFWKDYSEMGIEYALKKYAYPTLFGRFKRGLLKPILIKAGVWKIIEKARKKINI